MMAGLLLGSVLAALPANPAVDVTLAARLPAVKHTTDDGFVSFAVDAEWILGGRDTPFQPVKMDFGSARLRRLVSLTAGGYLRFGGDYTDFLHYAVPGANHTRCPLPAGQAGCDPLGYPSQFPARDGHGPCCLTLTMERWRETLDFAHATGMKVALNLNALNGRWREFIAHHGKSPLARTCWDGNQSATLPAWDPSEAEALMRWTKANVPAERWPRYYGLGNELTGIIPPQVYAADIATLGRTIDKVFGAGAGAGAGAGRPKVYAPCGCETPHANVELLSHVKEHGTTLDAWSWHTYDVSAAAPFASSCEVSKTRLHSTRRSAQRLRHIFWPTGQVRSTLGMGRSPRSTLAPSSSSR